MRRGKAAALLTTGIVLLSSAACGSDGGDGGGGLATSDYDCSKPDGDNPEKISVAGMPILTNGALFAAIDEGIFAKHGLEPTVEFVASPPAAVASLSGGSVDFAYATTQLLLSAVDKGQPIRGVASFAGIEPGSYEKMKADEEGYRGVTALLVKEDSGIESPKGLEGKTVAVSDPDFAQLLVQQVIKDDGGDPDSVKFVFMPGPDAYTAVQAGKVDGAFSFYPVIEGYEDKGLRNLAWLAESVFHEGPMSFFVATNDYIDENADTVARFNCAIAEASEFSNNNADAVRSALAAAQDVDPETYANQNVSYFFPQIDTEGVERVQDVMLEFDRLTKRHELDELMAPVVLSEAGGA
jgi:NitT/TauT family transport system substrate-binding protein